MEARMDTFERLPNEKKETILEAGFACFGRDGYAKTSVADIAGTAGVSKAALFHYFGTKKKLWIYLYDFASEVLINGIFVALETAEQDFFERLCLAQEKKLSVVAKYPGMYAFLARSITEKDLSLREQCAEKNKPYIEQGFAALLKGVDLAKFKPGVDVQMVIDIVTWVGNGYAQENAYTNPPQDVGPKALRYIRALKPAFYKEEYL